LYRAGEQRRVQLWRMPQLSPPRRAGHSRRWHPRFDNDLAGRYRGGYGRGRQAARRGGRVAREGGRTGVSSDRGLLSYRCTQLSDNRYHRVSVRMCCRNKAHKLWRSATPCKRLQRAERPCSLPALLSSSHGLELAGGETSMRVWAASGSTAARISSNRVYRLCAEEPDAWRQR